MREKFQCPECGCPNEVGRIFCVRCGVKLDFTQMRRPIRIDLGGILEGIFRLVVFLVVLSVVVLIVWPLDPAGQTGDADDARGWLSKRDQLQNDGAEKVDITETSLNAYLAATFKSPVTNSTEAVNRWAMSLAALNVTLRPDHVTVMAVTQWGPLTITWAVRGVPRVVAGRSILDIKDGRWGHLPLPRAIATGVANRMAALLVRWPQDREMLEQLTAVALDAGRATLTTRPAQPKQEQQ